MLNAVGATVNYWHSWQCQCPWHRFPKVFTEMCFILEEYLMCAFGVLVEANLDSVCTDVPASNSRSLASLFGCVLLFAFEDIRSPPAVTHTQTHFQAWRQQQNSARRVQRNSVQRTLKQRCSCWTAVRASAFLYRAPTAHKSHTSTSRLWLSIIMENVKGYGASAVILTAWERFRWTERWQV